MATNTIVYRDYVFQGSDIQEGNPYTEVSLPSSALGSNTIQVTVKCNDPAIVDFQRNDPLLYTRGDHLPERYFVQSISRVGTNRYTISATSIVGLLEQMEHKGGIYTGQTVPEVVGEICGSLPVKVKTIFQDTALYGWLPYVKPPESSARDNLAQVLFAIGAYLGVDQEGVLRVEPLWDGVSSAVTADRVYNDGSVDYGSAVSSVSVLEHQYLDIDTEDTTTLFDGTATANITVIFDDPMFNLQATGFSILESGANYAVLSAGTGTLTGIPYLHTTREVVRTVTPGATENVKTISDATLVSLVNSQAVAERMAEYYKHTVTINNPILAESERAGHVVSIYDPYDRVMVNACISSMDVTMSAKARAETAALVGFKPPQPGTIPYYDFREVLTGSGEWTVPDGVTSVGYVLFSGAQGGKAGRKGGDSGTSKTITYQIKSWMTGEVSSKGGVTVWDGPGGIGGLGGEGGKGSKIYQGNISVTPGQKISYNCGIGGEGATYDANNPDAEGAEGTDTTFGEISSSMGSYPQETGWTDPTTEETFSTPGLDGLPGGNGAGGIDGYEIPSNENDLNVILKYQPSTPAVDEDGISWPGAPTKEKSGQTNVAYWQTYDTNPYYNCGAWAGYALGPGGVAGVTQSEPTNRGTNNYANATAADGVTPPAPTLIPKKPALTLGGRGGYGGGGASCASWGGYEYDPRESVTPSKFFVVAGEPGVGGPGGKGGPGGDGMIILLYQTPGPPVLVEAAVTSNQKWRLDKYGRRCIV